VQILEEEDEFKFDYDILDPQRSGPKRMYLLNG